VQEAAERILAGDTLRSVCMDLNDRKVSTITGTPWSTTVLKNLLVSYRISGQRDYKGESVVTATWPAIISPTQTTRLRSLLLDPARRTNRSPRAYPLKGLVVCGLCGAKMVARPNGEGARRYACAKGPGFVGCGKIFQLAEPLENLIAEAVLFRLDSDDFRRTTAAQSSEVSQAQTIEQDLQEDRLQLDELAEMYGRKEMSAREWTMAKAPIQQRISDHERRLGTITGTSALDTYANNPGLLRSQWSTLAPPRQQAIVAALLDTITIGPAVRGRNTFDPARVTPHWKA
jgi:site-specific DNA recombinase